MSRLIELFYKLFDFFKFLCLNFTFPLLVYSSIIPMVYCWQLQIWWNSIPKILRNTAVHSWYVEKRFLLFYPQPSSTLPVILFPMLLQMFYSLSIIKITNYIFSLRLYISVVGSKHFISFFVEPVYISTTSVQLLEIPKTYPRRDGTWDNHKGKRKRFFVFFLLTIH